MLTRYIILLLILFFISPIQGFCAVIKPNNDLKVSKATYNLYWHGIKVGKSIHTVRKTNTDHFWVEWTSKPLISFLPFKSYEKSEFYLKNYQIYPVQYIYNTQEKKKRKSGEIHFNQIASLPNKAQDKISLYFQLRQDLFLQKKNFSYTVIEPERIKTYTFKIIGETNLKTPLGVLKTIQVEHISSNQERLTKFWLAKDLDYLIIKLQQVKKGKIIAESTLQRLET